MARVIFLLFTLSGKIAVTAGNDRLLASPLQCATSWISIAQWASLYHSLCIATGTKHHPAVASHSAAPLGNSFGAILPFGAGWEADWRKFPSTSTPAFMPRCFSSVYSLKAQLHAAYFRRFDLSASPSGYTRQRTLPNCMKSCTFASNTLMSIGARYRCRRHKQSVLRSYHSGTGMTPDSFNFFVTPGWNGNEMPAMLGGMKW